MSPILFVMGMGMVTRTAERETSCLRPRMYSIFQLPIRPYGDNNDPYTGKMGPISQQTSQDANSRRGDPINSFNSNLMLGKVV